MKTQEKSIKCPCGSNEFSINLNNVESIALLTCKKCEKNYFLLDSGDYWYDSIQEKYPPQLKCSKCKNDTFSFDITYEFRENYKDVKYIKIVGACRKCDLPKQFGTWEIKYGGTASLIKHPIVVCNNPKIKYDLLTKNCFWTLQDMIKFLEFLYGLKLSIYCQYFENKKLLTEKSSKEEAINRASNQSYYHFFASKKELIIPRNQEINWKKEEVISIPSPTRAWFGEEIGEKVGLLFNIEYTTNYIGDFKLGKVKKKSAEFKEIVITVDTWLKLNYDNSRGKNSFDNPEELKRLFEGRFLKKDKTMWTLIKKLLFRLTKMFQ